MAPRSRTAALSLPSCRTLGGGRSWSCPPARTPAKASDFPALGYLVPTSPSRSPTRAALTQYVCRILLSHETRPPPKSTTTVDERTVVLAAMLAKRAPGRTPVSSSPDTRRRIAFTPTAPRGDRQHRLRKPHIMRECDIMPANVALPETATEPVPYAPGHAPKVRLACTPAQAGTCASRSQVARPSAIAASKPGQAVRAAPLARPRPHTREHP